MPAQVEVSPWNPSRKATARVKNPLPIPDACPNCSGPIEIVNNSVIYGGKAYGEWPWALHCKSDVCDSFVGLHPFTGIPLGTLANKLTRAARKTAKALFNPLWENGGPMTRDEAYAWLAQAMGIADGEKCHIGWMDYRQCQRATRAILERK